MTMSLVWLGIGSVLAGEQIKIDIEKGFKLLKEDRKYKVVQLASPCLKPDAPKRISNLEDCLMMGELATPELEYDRDLWDSVPKEKREGEEEGAAVIYAYKAVGLNPNMDRPTGHHPFYQGDFAKRLRQLFPKSKYFAEVTYCLDLKGLDPEPYQKYIQQYPQSKFLAEALLFLAAIHDSRWSHEEGFKGQAGQKKLAQDTYRKALAAPESQRWWVDSSDLKRARERITGLEKNVPAPFRVSGD